MAGTDGQVLNLLPTATLAAAATAYGPTSAGLPIDPNASSVTLEIFFVRAGGGTSCDVYLQTSFDAGATWVDIAHNAFLTTTASRVFTVNGNGAVAVTTAPTDATLTADTKLDGVLGDYLRVKYVTVGTYTGASSLTVRAFVKTGGGGIGSVGVSAITAGETHIGEVGGKTIVIKPTITVDTGIYAALDVLGALVVSGVVTLTSAMRISGGTGVLESVTVFDDDNEKNPITLLFFDSAPASGTYVGNGALSFSTGDKAKFIGKVNITASDYETVGGEALACIKGIGLGVAAVGSANLYMIPIVTSGTPTYTASTDIQMVLTFLAD